MYLSSSQNQLPVADLSASFTSSYTYFFCSKLGVAVLECSEFPKLKICGKQGEKHVTDLSGEHLRVSSLHYPLGAGGEINSPCVVLSVPAVKICKYKSLIHGHSL